MLKYIQYFITDFYSLLLGPDLLQLETSWCYDIFTIFWLYYKTCYKQKPGLYVLKAKVGFLVDGEEGKTWSYKLA